MTFEKGVKAVVPFGTLAGGIVFGKCLTSQQHTEG